MRAVITKAFAFTLDFHALNSRFGTRHDVPDYGSRLLHNTLVPGPLPLLILPRVESQ